MDSFKRKLLVVVIFSVAMAALESAVVVYLRALYYPGTFTVAMKMIDQKIVFVELIREVSTLCMLGAVAFLSAQRRYDRFAFFLLSFGVWDIFYYVWLKIFIDWPLSFFDWDILFLIPITWLGPVLSPIICSLTMILLALLILRLDPDVRISTRIWGLLTAGALIVLYTFIVDYGMLLFSNGLISDYLHLLQNQSFIKLASSYIPAHYNWGLFSIGEVLMAVSIFMIYRLPGKRNHGFLRLMETDPIAYI